MIIFHGGLPRSGKSYEAVVRRVIPALQAGRPVMAYIDGLDHEKIALAADMDLAKVRELLTVITVEQAKEWWVPAPKNGLILLDEIQDYHGNRARLNEAATTAVTQHGHFGQDIVLMGQDYRDVHAIWRRRIEMRFEFLKLSAVGAEKRYSVTAYRHKGQDEWERIGTTPGHYDPKYFGTYASHVSTEIQTANYKDNRTSLIHSPFIKFGIPVALAAGIWGAWNLWGFFRPAPAAKPAVMASTAAPSGPRAAAAGPVQAGPAQAVAKAPDTRSVQEVYFSDLSGKGRIRLAGLMTMGGKADGVIEWLEGSSVTARMTFEELRQLGVSLVVSQSVVRLYLGEWQAMAIMWPVEPAGVVSAATQDALRRQAGGTPAPTPAAPVIVAPAPILPTSRGTDMTVGRKPI